MNCQPTRFYLMSLGRYSKGPRETFNLDVVQDHIFVPRFFENKFKIMFQDFGNIILKMNLDMQKSRSSFKILSRICLNKIIDFAT